MRTPSRPVTRVPLGRVSWVRWAGLVGLIFFLGACSNVPVHRTFPPLHLGAAAFFPTLEAYAQAPIVPGNRLTLLLNGEKSSRPC